MSLLQSFDFIGWNSLHAKACEAGAVQISHLLKLKSNNTTLSSLIQGILEPNSSGDNEQHSAKLDAARIN
jgi:hypothetical protein